MQKMEVCRVLDMLISLIVAIISQYIHISNHQDVHLKYIQFYSDIQDGRGVSVFVNYTSINVSEISSKN